MTSTMQLDAKIRFRCIEKAMELNPRNAEDAVQAAKKFYDFIVPSYKTSGDVNKLSELASPVSAPKDSNKKTGSKLTNKQQECLDAIRELDRLGGVICVYRIMNYLKISKSNQPMMNARVKSLADAGYITRTRLGKKLQIKLVKGDLSGEKVIPINQIKPHSQGVKTAEDIAKDKAAMLSGPKIPPDRLSRDKTPDKFFPKGKYANVLTTICNDYQIKSAVYTKETIGRATMLPRADAIEAVKTLVAEGYLRMKNDLIIPVQNSHGTSINPNISAKKQ